MKAIQNSAAQNIAAQSSVSAFSPVRGQAQQPRKERSAEPERGYDPISRYESKGAEDLPGVGLGQSFQQSMEGFDTRQQSAGVADVVEERQRRLQSDVGLQMVTGGLQAQSRSRVASTSETEPLSGLDAYRARIQSSGSPVSTVRSRASFEARMEERLEALMAAQGIKVSETQEPEVKLPTSPWDVAFQRSEAADALGYKQHNYMPTIDLESLPRVGL